MHADIRDITGGRPLHPALLGEALPDGRVYCHLCPHACKIREGATGVCGARGVVDGELKALTYGLVSSVANDPIEKKPVFHFHPGSLVLSLGSVGCSMRCGHCQNWRISRPKIGDGGVDVGYLSPEDAVELARGEGSAGIAFTYNEPVIWLEYVLDTARLAHEAGLFTIMVTNGYVTAEGLDCYAEVIDVWRVDVKGCSAQTYRSLCKIPHHEAIFEQAKRARHEFGMHVEVVTNIIPTVNDSDEELACIARFIAEDLGPDTPWHITRFYPYLDYGHLPPTPVETLAHAREIGEAAGLTFIYTGNVDVPGGEDTVCPRCNARAVVRDGFSVRTSALDTDGACGACHADLNVTR